MEQKIKGVPPRLPVVFQHFGLPLYFVTFNTLFKRPLLANEAVLEAFRSYAKRGASFHVGTGRYVLMPDHVHLFVRIGPNMTLRRWVGGLKQCLGKTLRELGYEPIEAQPRHYNVVAHQASRADMKLSSFWQPGFFDHLLRQDESYEQKWGYVWRNPVRAGLVKRPEDWPYQGEVHRIDRVR